MCFFLLNWKMKKLQRVSINWRLNWRFLMGAKCEEVTGAPINGMTKKGDYFIKIFIHLWGAIEMISLSLPSKMHFFQGRGASHNLSASINSHWDARRRHQEWWENMLLIHPIHLWYFSTRQLLFFRCSLSISNDTLLRGHSTALCNSNFSPAYCKMWSRCNKKTRKSDSMRD